MRLLSSLISLLVCVSGVLGQSSVEKSVCTDKTVGNISSRGIKIGAAIDEVTKGFDPIRLIRAEKGVGHETVVVFPGQTDLSNGRFKKIRLYNFEFLDGALVSYKVVYDGPIWHGMDEYISRLIESFNLPSMKDWSIDGARATLHCQNYELAAEFDERSQASSFEIIDNRLNEIFPARKKKLEDQKRESDIRAFKP